MSKAYYNEHDPEVAQWLRNLIMMDLIAPGDVDERSIEDVTPNDLAGYTQCHFFAGIGGWSLALRMAGWPDDRPVWTGSCPCQPFSAAGKGEGFADERHLWPAFHWLIERCAPRDVFGEQVASKDGLAWLDLVQADCQGTGYAFRAQDRCAAGVGAPHIRQRLYWLAHANDARLEGWGQSERERSVECSAGTSGVVGGVADAGGNGREMAVQHSRSGDAQAVQRETDVGRGGCASSRMADTDGTVGSQSSALAGRRDQGSDAQQGAGSGGDGCAGGEPAAGPVNGQWRAADWLYCRDGKWRPVEPGTFPLADGVPGRVVKLRAYGNAIVPQVAAEFISEYMNGHL